MDLLMNGLLMAATLFAGGYCWVLARRVQDLKSLDRGLGGSIVTLTRQIELARATLDEARGASKETRQDLAQLIGKADAAANQLKLLIAAAPVYPPAPRPETRAEPGPETMHGHRLETFTSHDVSSAGTRPLTLPEMPSPVISMKAEAAPLVAPGTPAMNLAEVPKPRALAPVENPLRRAKGTSVGRAEGPGASEDAILEALSALAGGGR